MLNPSSDEFTLHVTLQKSFSAVYTLYRIDSYIAESYFCCFYNYVACVCSKILLPLSYIFMVYLVPCIFLLLVLNCRYGKTGMACLLQYTFLTSKPVSGKKWETTDFYCDSIAATLTSLLPARREVQDKS